MRRWHVAVALICAALSACTGAPPDARLPSEIAFPAPDDWRRATHDLAGDIVSLAEKQGISEAAAVAPVQGSAPPYFRDLLLADLLERGMRVTEEGTPSFKVTCRVTPIGISPHPRGLISAPAEPGGEILTLCLLEHDGAYVAAARRVLPVPENSRQPAKGVVMEVKG
jgi:hypothetical protein